MNRKQRRELRKHKNIRISYYKYILECKSYVGDAVKMGRNRWKFENKDFYTQKHRAFNITHLSSRNNIAIKAHYFLFNLLIPLDNYLNKKIYILSH